METFINKLIVSPETKRIRRKKLAVDISIMSVKYVFIALLAVFFLFPFFIMLTKSFLPDKEALSTYLFSKNGIISVTSYIRLFQKGLYLGYLKNSITIALLSAVGIPFFSSLCAYGFARRQFTGKNIVFGVVLATMMIPSIVVQIPLYSLYTKIGWGETLLPLWLPAWFGGGATNIFLMTQFMKGIPKDLDSAAKIDGANSFIIFSVLVVPLCIPVFLYVMVSSFIGSWNDFMTPLLYITDKTKFPLSLGIYKDYGTVSAAYNILPNIQMAAGVVMMLPCLVLFFIFQRYLIEGVTVTGLKG